MPSVGKIDTFGQSQETFPRYVRVKNILMANGIEDDRQKYVFLNSLGHKHYNLLANLLSPESKSLDEAVAALTTHFQPKSCVISERYSFHWNHAQADFVVSLNKLIIRCGYTVVLQPIVV